MSRSIHETINSVAKSNKKNELTIDNPDVINLAQKKRYKKKAASGIFQNTDKVKPQ